MKPDPGKPEVRNFREDAGNVAYGARANVLADRWKRGSMVEL